MYSNSSSDEDATPIKHTATKPKVNGKRKHSNKDKPVQYKMIEEHHKLVLSQPWIVTGFILSMAMLGLVAFSMRENMLGCHVNSNDEYICCGWKDDIVPGELWLILHVLTIIPLIICTIAYFHTYRKVANSTVDHRTDKIYLTLSLLGSGLPVMFLTIAVFEWIESAKCWSKFDSTLGISMICDLVAICCLFAHFVVHLSALCCDLKDYLLAHKHRFVKPKEEEEDTEMEQRCVSTQQTQERVVILDDV